MDKDVIRNKLASLVRCLERIDGRKPENPDDLKDDFDAQDIITLNLERAVQLCVDIGLHILADYAIEAPDTMSEVFIRMKEQSLIPAETAENLSKAVGFRNIAVHQYRNIDWAIVFSILKENKADFTVFSQHVFPLLSE